MELPEPPEWWKKIKPLRWLLGFTVLFAIASHIYRDDISELLMVHPETPIYLARDPNPVLLMDGLKSHEGVDAVTALLAERQLRADARRVKKPGTSRNPPGNLDTLKLAPYLHLGIEGELTLEFFNDRLYEAYFLPSDTARYLRALKPAEPSLKRDQRGYYELLQGPRRVASNIEFSLSEVGRATGATAFIVWQDTRLVRERAQWDRDFGALPVAP